MWSCEREEEFRGRAVSRRAQPGTEAKQFTCQSFAHRIQHGTGNTQIER